MESTNSKWKAVAALDEDISGGENTAVDAPAPAESETPPQGEAPRTKPRSIMSQEWIDQILASKTKPMRFKERHLRDDPELAAIVRSHEEYRARHEEYKAWVRRELATKGYIEVTDDYEATCELYQAVYSAVFRGDKEGEKEAMAKLAALPRAR